MAAAPNDRAAVLKTVTDCRAVADSAARLACYDGAVAKLDAATAKKEIVILDREEVRETRKGLFGFTLPKLPFFKGDDSKNDTPTEILTTATSARSLGYGKWRVVVEGGAIWETTEAVVHNEPHEGSKIKIKQGLVGSYMMNIDGSLGVRVRRTG